MNRWPWAVFALGAAIAGACSGGSEGSEGEFDPIADAGTKDVASPIPPTNDGGGDAMADGSTCQKGWQVLGYNGDWDRGQDVLQVTGGELSLFAKAQPATSMVCDGVVPPCEPIRVVQEVMGDFEVSVDLTSVDGTIIDGQGSLDRIPVAGLYVGATTATNFQDYGYAHVRKTAGTTYDVVTSGGDMQPGGSTTGNANDIMPQVKLSAKRVGDLMTIRADFQEKGGGMGSRVYNLKFVNASSTGPVHVGLYVGGNFTGTRTIDMKGTFDNFTVTSGTGLQSDDFSCNSLP